MALHPYGVFGERDCLGLVYAVSKEEAVKALCQHKEVQKVDFMSGGRRALYLTICTRCLKRVQLPRKMRLFVCRSCRDVLKRAYYEKNRDKISALQRAYREKNRDKIRAYMRSYMRHYRKEAT